MRWFLWLLLVVALVTGALYGVGRFLLPNDAGGHPHASIERPRAAVFAMVNDLRIAKEWSPYYARDPDADYAFSGEPGAGPDHALGRPTSAKSAPAACRSSSSRENEEVAEHPGTGRARDAEFRIELRRGEGGNGGGLGGDGAMRRRRDERAVPVHEPDPARHDQGELDSGLARLKTLAEQLPNVDFEGLNPQFDRHRAAERSSIPSVETAADDLVEVNRAEAHRRSIRCAAS